MVSHLNCNKNNSFSISIKTDHFASSILAAFPFLDFSGVSVRSGTVLRRGSRDLECRGLRRNDSNERGVLITRPREPGGQRHVLFALVFSEVLHLLVQIATVLLPGDRFRLFGFDVRVRTLLTTCRNLEYFYF